MNQKNKRFHVYAYTLLTLCAVSITLRTVGAFLGVNEYGFFENPLPATVSGWMLAVGVLFCLSYPMTRKRPAALIATFMSPGTLFFSAFIVTALGFLLTKFTPAIKVLIRIFLERTPLTEKILSYFPYLITASIAFLLAILSIGYFAAHALIPEVKSNLRAYLGMSAALFYASYAALLYFDTTLPINAPAKLADQAAYLFCALFFLFETRIALGREKWGLYTTFGLIAAATCAYSAIPTVLMYIINGQMISASIYEATLTLASFFFILSRLILMRRLKTDAPSPFVSLIRSVAKGKAEETLPEVEESLEESHEESEDEPYEATDGSDADTKEDESVDETDAAPEESAEVTPELAEGEAPVFENVPIENAPSIAENGTEEQIDNAAVTEEPIKAEGELL